MRILTIIMILILFSCGNQEKENCNYITDYYQNTAKAEIEFYSGNYQEAFDFYQIAFRNCKAINIGTHNDTWKFAKVCAELGKTKLALNYIEKRIINGGVIGEFQRDDIFKSILNSTRGQKIVSGYNKMREEHIATLNLDLRAELQKMIEIEQNLNSTKLDDSIYRVNDKRLVEIFEKYGYPNEQIVGSYIIDRISADPTILLLHSRDSIRINYFIPKINKYVRDGKCPPIIAGLLYDNLELYNDQQQTHGTYTNINGGYPNMISDISKVNSNRLSIGLPTLEMTEKIDSLKSH